MTVGFKRPTLLIGGGYLHRGGSTPLSPPIRLVGSKITEGVRQVSKDKVLGNCPCVDVQYLFWENDGVPQEGPGRVLVSATSDREREVTGEGVAQLTLHTDRRQVSARILVSLSWNSYLTGMVQKAPLSLSFAFT